MTSLALLLIMKIGITLPGIALPFLLLPKTLVDRLSGFQGTPTVLYRLYGLAILALLVGYAGGLFMVWNGAFPWGVVVMGIVSNGGAAILLIGTGTAKSRRLLTLFFALITVGLGLSAWMPDAAMAPL